MLEKLSIRNYAIIDELEISFSDHLSVITGETGAGKSIILGALGLILGERADSTVLVNKENKSVVEGVFSMKGRKQVEEFLRSNDFDIQDELFIRREIAVNGKSRAFINDTPVNLSQLAELSSLMVDLHQQFDTLELTANDFQLQVVDALAGNDEAINGYRIGFAKWQQLRKETAELKEQKLRFDKEADYNRFQFTELDEAGFKENELEEIDAELTLLNNAEAVKATLDKVYFELRENETPVVQQLKVLINQLSGYASLHPELPSLLERLQSTHIELQDIASGIEHISNQVNYDPQRIGELNERLSIGYKLQKKHGVSSTNELLEIHRQLEEKLQAVLDIDDAIQQNEKQEWRSLKDITEKAAAISKARHKQSKPLEEKVNKLLAQVGMPNAKLKVQVTDTALNASGADSVEFLFDANKSGQFQPVRKVASGGELSRLMLCIKSLVAQSMDLPTLIFDEIDTGISGEAARQVAIIMKGLAVKRQVICITHQPQIAGKADAHYFVYKEIVKAGTASKEKIKTNIRQLGTEERITAIAKMLSGEKPTAAAMENAREMLMN